MKEDIKNDTKNINTDKLHKDLEEAKAKCEEYLNGWKRERADFLNYKKDEMERIGQLAKYANEELILKIIPILDNIYLAESHIPVESLTSPKGSAGQTSQAWKVWIDGFNQIKDQLLEFLKKEGVEPMKTLYEKFDPNYMEVVEEVPARESSHDGAPEESGIAVEVVQMGYTMHGKIIRVAKVKLTK